MRILGIIPARYASKRFPGKPLADCKGKSMVRRVYEQAIQGKSLQKVIVATDDQRIFDEVISFKGEAMISGKPHTNGTERCAEVLERFPGYDYVINIQCDEPFLHPELIDQLGSMLDGNVQIATLATKIANLKNIKSPNTVKVVLSQSGKALYFSRNVLPYKVNNNHHNYFKHLGIYGYRSDTLLEISKLPPSRLEESEKLEQLRWLENDYSIQVGITIHDSMGVDTPEELTEVLEKL